MTGGFLIIIAASWWFADIVEDILTRDLLTVVDTQVAQWFHDRATPTLTAAAIVITFLGSPPFVGGMSIAVALVLAWRHSWNRLLALVMTMGGGTLLIILLKAFFQRNRPTFEKPLITLTSYSFPSGHVMGTTLLFGLIAFMVATYLDAWVWRIVSILLAVLFVLLIALTRIYLGLHYFSDVLGAAAAGLAWLAFSLIAVEIFLPGTRTYQRV